MEFLLPFVDRAEILKPNKLLSGIFQASRKQPISIYDDQVFLAIDPGETTGIAVYYKGEFFCAQLDTSDVATGTLKIAALISQLPKADHVRIEDYKVYAWKAQDHANASLHTPQIIGAIKYMLHLEHIPCSVLMAQQAKVFWTDDKLKKCSLYATGIKHGRDAIRHILFLMCFPRNHLSK